MEELQPSGHYDDYYKNEISSRFHAPVELVVRLFRLYRALKIFTIAPRAKSILDIGSGRGYTLYYLKRYFGFTRTVGTQISRPALEHSRRALGLEVYGEDLLDHDWGSDRFDVVTLWHVLEHVASPERYVQKIGELLTPDGRLIIEVPNFSSWSRPLVGPYWLGLDLKYHISFFTPDSLVGMLERNGFRAKIVHTFSLEYSTFISTSSLVSRLTGTDQRFFAWLQGQPFTPSIVAHAALFVLIAPFALVVNLLLFFSKRGEVLVVVGKKLL